MKAVKRSFCSACGWETTTTDVKTLENSNISATLKCKRCSEPLKISVGWIVCGQINGKRFKQNCGPNKATAESFITACQIKKLTESVLPGREEDIQWHEAIESCRKWWAEKLRRGSIKQNTVDFYESQLISLNKWFGDKSLLAITKRDLEQYMGSRLETIAVSTLQHEVKTLRRVYNMHIENLDLDENPRPRLRAKSAILLMVKLPSVNNKNTRFCTIDEVKKVFLALEQNNRIRAIDKARLRVSIMLGIGIGLRHINICSLKWSYIDFERETISIPGTEMKNKTDYHSGLPPILAAELQKWRKACSTISLYVFPSPADGKTHIADMSNAIDRLIEEAGLNPVGVTRAEKVTPYVLTLHDSASQVLTEIDNIKLGR